MTRALMECISEAAVLCTAQGEVLHRNRAADRLLKDRAAVGRSIFESGGLGRLRSRIQDAYPSTQPFASAAWEVPVDSDAVPVYVDGRWLRATLQPLTPSMESSAGTDRPAPKVRLACKERIAGVEPAGTENDATRPVASSPAASGPAASGPAASGPAASGPAASGPVDPENDACETPEWFVLRLEPGDRIPESAVVPHDVLRTLIETLREPIASVRAAIETIQLYPDMDVSTSGQFLKIIEEQTEMLGRHLDSAIKAYALAYREEGSLKPVPTGDLRGAVHAAVGNAVDVPATTQEEEGEAVGMVDLQALMAVVRFLAQRIENASRCAALHVRVRPVRGLVAIELEWEGTPVTSARLRKWQEHSLSWGRSIVEMTVRDVIDHHDAQMVARSHSEGQHLRLLLPQASRTAP